MNSLGVRALMQTPPLPRITSHDQAGDPAAGEFGRTTHRGPVLQADPRLPAFVTKQPGRFVTSSGAVPVTKKPGCFVTSPAASRTAVRVASPAAAAAKIVEPPIASRLRQGNVIRLALGDLVIELALRDSLLYGKVLAETASAKDLIESRLDDLRRDLERKGVEVARFEVLVADPEPAASEEPPLRSVRRRLLDVRA